MIDRSSAWFVPYNIRPGKQTERRIIFEALVAASRAGLCLASMEYIGMGGVRFVDFLMAHKLLGIEKFWSIEGDSQIVPRCEFNKPFHSIRVFSGSSTEFVDQHEFASPSVIWLDYEMGICADLRDEMIAVAGNIAPGSFLFVTITAQLPKHLSSIKGLPKRLDDFRQQISPLGSKLVPDHMNARIFEKTAIEVLYEAVNYGFSGRGDGTFRPFLRILYKDSTWMATVGGFFGGVDEGARVLRQLSDSLPFLNVRKQTDLVIENFNITDAERRIFDLASLREKGRRAERLMLRELGFGVDVIEQYGDLMRFIPRYVEAFI